jgi:hypothetical protein
MNDKGQDCPKCGCSFKYQYLYDEHVPCNAVRSTSFEPSTIGQKDTYRCTVPMCGESGVCEECRKRGAR